MVSPNWPMSTADTWASGVNSPMATCGRSAVLLIRLTAITSSRARPRRGRRDRQAGGPAGLAPSVRAGRRPVKRAQRSATGSSQGRLYKRKRADGAKPVGGREGRQKIRFSHAKPARIGPPNWFYITSVACSWPRFHGFRRFRRKRRKRSDFRILPAAGWSIFNRVGARPPPPVPAAVIPALIHGFCAYHIVAW